MARRQATIFINGKEVANTIKSITSEKRKLNNELRNLIIGTEEYEKKAAELKRVNGVLSDHRQQLRSTSGALDKMRAGINRFIGIAATAFTVDAVLEYGKQLFNLGTQMEVLVKKAETVFGEALPQVTAAARENAAAMGLTTREYIGAAAAIGDLLIPMGFQREEAANISTELVNLSGALSEWTGGQIKSADVSRILSKALLGEREELKQLGISILESDVQNRLREKGLEKLTGTLLEQAKATATLELVTEKSLDAQQAFTENSDTLVRRQAEVSAKLSEVSEKLATLLIPVFERLLGVAESTVNFFIDLTDGLNSIINPAKSAVDAFDQQTAAVAELEKNLVPLLDRYDELILEAKDNEEKQAELAEVIKKIGDITPKAIEEVDKYGKALRINADEARGLLEVERQRLLFTNQDAIKATEKEIEVLKRRQETLQRNVETGKQFLAQNFGGGRIEVPFDDKSLEKFKVEIAQITGLIQGAESEIKRLKGEKPDQSNSSEGKTPEQIAAEKAAKEAELQRQNEEEKRRKESQKAAERTLKEREKNLQRLQDITEKYRQEARIAQLDEEAQGIERIKQRYQKEIDLAIQLEEQGVKGAAEKRFELLRLRDQEIERYELEQSDKRAQAQLDRLNEQAEAELEEILRLETEKAEFEEELRAELNEVLLSEQEFQLLQLQEHYDRLLQLAESYGIDTTDIVRAYEKEQNDIRKKFSEEEIKRKENEHQAKLALVEAEIGTYKAVADALNTLAGENATITQAIFAFEKGVAIAEVILNLQKELASIAASNAALGPLAPAVIAAQSTAAKIRAGLRIATIGGTVIQSLVQKKAGGYLDVRGQDDNIQYRARYIGDPQTGMLPPTPVVLASEAGPEYFVSNKDLQNPRVLNYVRAIENIRLARTGQFVDGGATTALPAGNENSRPDPAMMALLQAINRLNENLEGGIQAMVEDDTIVSINKRFNKLNNAAGGTL